MLWLNNHLVFAVIRLSTCCQKRNCQNHWQFVISIQMGEHNSLPCGRELHDNIFHILSTLSLAINCVLHQIGSLICSEHDKLMVKKKKTIRFLHIQDSWPMRLLPPNSSGAWKFCTVITRPSSLCTGVWESENETSINTEMCSSSIHITRHNTMLRSGKVSSTVSLDPVCLIIHKVATGAVWWHGR